MFNSTRKPNYGHTTRIDYNDYWKSRGFEINKKLKEREHLMLDLIPSGSRVLDLGCGNSRLPVALKERGCEVEVGDVSDIVLKGYEEFGVRGHLIDLEKVAEVAFKTPYDVIIMSEVLEHMSYPEEVLHELRTCAKTFILTVPNSAFYRYRFHLMFKGRFFTQWVHHPSEHLRFWSHLDFLDWLSALGFEVSYTRASNGFDFFGTMPFFKDVWPNMFGHQMVYKCSPIPGWKLEERNNS